MTIIVSRFPLARLPACRLPALPMAQTVQTVQLRTRSVIADTAVHGGGLDAG